MFSRETLDIIWTTARTCHQEFPHSYQNLFGPERLAVLPLLQEPLQSTIHQIVQQQIDAGTTCIYKDCTGILDKHGRCQHRCEQSGQTAVHDIMECKNCDTCGFPCPNCQTDIFQNQLSTQLEDY